MQNFESGLKGMSRTQLEEMAKAIKFEMDARDDARFKELCVAFCDAARALKLEYPWVSLDIDVECDDCDCVQEINIFEYLDDITPAVIRK